MLVGPEAQDLSASTVARFKADLVGGVPDLASAQRFDQEDCVYVWIDGICRGVRADHQRLCALVVSGVTSQGEKQLLAIDDGVRESTQIWREVLLSLKAPGGQKAPTVAVGDGTMGFWGALEEIYPKTRHQRCWVHKTRNVLNALPKSVQPKAKQAFARDLASRDQSRREPGVRGVSEDL